MFKVFILKLNYRHVKKLSILGWSILELFVANHYAWGQIRSVMTPIDKI
jgi:hypothetical protein